MIGNQSETKFKSIKPVYTVYGFFHLYCVTVCISFIIRDVFLHGFRYRYGDAEVESSESSWDTKRLDGDGGEDPLCLSFLQQYGDR